MVVLLGRDKELAELGRLLDGVHEQGGALVVRGPSGIGKSALLAAGRTRARRSGMAVAAVSGVQSESHLPFAGLHQLLQPMLDAVDGLPVRQRMALQGAFGTGDAVAPEPFLIALAVLNLLAESAGDRPLLLSVDDAQWLDNPTLEVLGFVARRVASEPIALLLAVRDGHRTGLDASDLPELHLAGLDAATSEALLDAQAPGLGVGLRWRVLAEAAGNPLALVELPVALRTGAVSAEFLPLTTRLERSFAARLAELPAPTAALLLAAAANDGSGLAEALAATSLSTGAAATSDALTWRSRRAWWSRPGRRSGSAIPSSAPPSTSGPRTPTAAPRTPRWRGCARAIPTAAPGTAPPPSTGRTRRWPSSWRASPPARGGAARSPWRCRRCAAPPRCPRAPRPAPSGSCAPPGWRSSSAGPTRSGS